ncbi:hypothetical protein IC235_11285 [Hymenobacter sp. BT664]|uniref:Uncharacterized protein n=1 Tax=Hymenobacter montanus TaxID=2771359 RepID=A0A927GJG6_9BACT|nr:hypothetical protein [Hymenobacter montanus]MBD2768473.1 hypothetical protein [Hymenobacter montanus]
MPEITAQDFTAAGFDQVSPARNTFPSEGHIIFKHKDVSVKSQNALYAHAAADYSAFWLATDERLDSSMVLLRGEYMHTSTVHLKSMVDEFFNKRGGRL